VCFLLKIPSGMLRRATRSLGKGPIFLAIFLGVASSVYVWRPYIVKKASSGQASNIDELRRTAFQGPSVKEEEGSPKGQ